MNWIKTLWNKLVNKTSVSPTLVVVEEVEERDVAEIFYDICREAGISHKDLARNVVVPTFVDWYEGESDEQAIRNSIDAFLLRHRCGGFNQQPTQGGLLSSRRLCSGVESSVFRA